jgi:hypothetical protein
VANPFPHENEIYKKIRKNRLTVHPEIWELINHHIGNDITVIELIVGSHVFGNNSEPIPVEHARRILNHCDQIRKFLSKLRKKIRKES